MPAVSRVLASGAAAFISVGAGWAVPSAAAAAPSPCERAQPYAAESDAQIFQAGTFDPRPAGGNGTATHDVGLGEARTALLGRASVNSAAAARLLDAAGAGSAGAGSAGAGSAGTPVVQSAPPSHPSATTQAIEAATDGPFGWGHATLSAHAQWDARMGCGTASGPASQASAVVGAAAIGSDLVRVRGQAGSTSTTSMSSPGRSQASAALAMRAFDLFDGAVHVRVMQAPSLTVAMSTAEGGSVHYTAPVVEISGDGVPTTRMSRPGQTADVAVDDEPAPDPGDPGAPDEPSNVVPEVGSLTEGRPLPIPTVPGLPPVSGSEPESGPASGPGTHLRITLGEVHRATRGTAIAARATAMTVTVTRGATPSGNGYRSRPPSGVVLDLNVGVLEAAAVAPSAAAPAGGVSAGGLSAGGVSSGGGVSAGGAGGGLPITGPATGILAAVGVGMVALGVAALALTSRRRRPTARTASSGPHRPKA